MQVHRLSYGVKGFVRLARYAIRWTRMVTDKAKHKARVLKFWADHGTKAATEAFAISKRTLYHWQAQIRKGEGALEALNERSKRPHAIRRRQWHPDILLEIKRQRADHPNLGKEKVHDALKKFCVSRAFPCPSVSTVGNLIRDMGGLRMFPVKVRHNGQIVKRARVKRTRKPVGFIPAYPGHCGAFDTIEKIIHGTRRYVITFTDVYSRVSFAWATHSHASLAAKEFFDLVKFLFPFPLECVLTDNGSEFMKHFDEELRRLHKVHWHTYPKTPKMNAHAERFNRTIQEEFINYHEPELLNPTRFNALLMKHLLWHNTERPHFALNLKSPVQFLTEKYPQECNMYLTNTPSCIFPRA